MEQTLAKASEKVIKIENLKKCFSQVRAVDDISFEVERGSLFAFLGLNGAGKSTTINIISSTLTKDSGSVIIDGVDIDADSETAKTKIGIVFQNSVLDDKLTVKDNLIIRASYYGIRGAALKSKLDELQKIFELEEFFDRAFNKLSGGQRRRVDIARALLHEPEILMLDEPTTGLDPKTRQVVWEIINGLRLRSKMTVFLTTHYMEEANRADRVVIIDGGKIVADDTPNNLKNKYSGDYVKLYELQSKSTDEFLSAYKDRARYEGECYTIKMRNNAEAKAFVVKNAERIGDFEVIKGDMDDVFLSITGKSLEGGKNG